MALSIFKNRSWKRAIICVTVLSFLLGMFAFPQPTQASKYKAVKYVTIQGGPKSNTDSTPIKIQAHYYIPNGTAPKAGWPAILFIHSWALQQNEYETKMAQFASQGYVTVCYTSRGWYGAQGKTGITSPLEVGDVSHVVDWMIDELPIDKKNIGATGVSYGGGTSMLTLYHEPRIKTVVAMSCWSDLIESLATNRTLKTSWAAMLAGTGYMLANPDDTISYFIKECLKNRDMYQDSKARERSIIFKIDEINDRDPVPPLFIVQGINEDLFTTGQLKRFYDLYEGPKKITFANGVHATSEASGLMGIKSFIWDDTIQWFDHWLKGEDNGIMEEDPISIYQKWNNSQGTYDEWPANDDLTYYPARNSKGTGVLGTSDEDDDSVNIKNNPLNYQTSSGIFYLAPGLKSHAGIYVNGTDPSKLGKNAFAFDTKTLTEDVTVMGIPHVTFKVKPNKDIYQVNFFVYDVEENGVSKLIDTTVYTDPDAAKGKIQTVDIDFNNYMAWRFKEGHKIRLVVTTANTSQFAPVQKAFNVDLIMGTGSKITFPIMD